ncbi:hypothetical protein GCM10010360_66540 [Streptomyces nogalater]
MPAGALGPMSTAQATTKAPAHIRVRLPNTIASSPCIALPSCLKVPSQYDRPRILGALVNR